VDSPRKFKPGIRAFAEPKYLTSFLLNLAFSSSCE